ncbi:MAG TPA: D-aminoacylase [Candidatus Hydrogenedentes bacterium]|nr:D-aminoacylase [Candidatus Hydrogenedentota bacterium]
MLDMLIRNGTVVNGSGKPRFPADVGIKGDRIVLVGQADGAKAKTEIDASGRMVCPGFVDPHSHADLSVFREDHPQLLEPLLRQGITTFVGGNCGMSLAPLQDKHRDEVEQYIEIFTRLDFQRDVPWRTMGEFLDTIADRGLVLNAAILAPHGLLRLNEVGAATRTATPEEVEGMAKALEQALEEGAIGLSTGLQYMPGSQSDTKELVQLAKVLKRHKGIFTSHLRSYSNTLERAIDEVIEVGETAGVPVQISHIFWIPDYGIAGPLVQSAVRAMARLSKWWTPPVPIDKPMQQRIDQMMAARERGVQIGMDVMPTTTGFTHILAFFPPWALTGTREDIIRRLRDPLERQKMRNSIEHGKMRWPHTGGDAWTLNLFRLMGWQCARIMSVQTKRNKRYEGMNLVDIAAERKVHPFDAACDLLLEEEGHVLVFESMAEPEDAFTERSMYAALRHPEVAISTDTILMGQGKPSHLFYGCYPKFIGRFVRELHLLPLETAVRKCTAIPADHFGLEGRGHIEKGAYADVVVFNYGKIESRATFLEPEHFPVGIEHVFVNGRHVVEGEVYRPEPRAGCLIRGA